MAAQEPTYVLDHVGLPVSDLETAKAFYTAALEPLGFSLLMEFPGAVGFGLPGKPQLWLHQAQAHPARPSTSPCTPRTTPASMPSTPRRWPPAAPTTAHPGRAPSTTPATTPPT